MNCEQVGAIIEDFREGALDKQNEEQVRAHLGGCRKCRELLTDLDVIDQKLRKTLGAVQPPLDFAGKIGAAISASVPATVAGPRQFTWVRPVLWAAAAAMVAVTIGLMAGYGKPERRGDPVQIPQNAAKVEGVSGPFVITTGDRVVPYTGKIDVKILRVVDGVPELLVNVFPDRLN
ncbi:MAG: hypothetical protein C0404_02245 [Verrucomicrobia bacterium]|nr:hypothetical protein [Verrucomicrobiota bacterium]